MSTLTPYERLKTVRSPARPNGEKYVRALFSDCVELCGDRRFAEDPAIVSGIGYIDGIAVTYIAVDRGEDIEARMKKHFGCPMPEGYRKALRLMKQAEKFRRPVVCLVDTMGAFCGADGEERGQGQAIAENLFEMMGLKTPIVSVIIGEGGSGGALALAAADRVYMLENAVYSVISPDGCASILWRDAGRAHDAAECLHITAEDMVKLGIAEGVVSEHGGDFDLLCGELQKTVARELRALSKLPTEKLLAARYARFRRIGVYEEGGDR